MIKWLLAWRYFVKRPISILAVVAVALCVFIVIVVMTVMSGLLRDFKQKNHDYAGDCVVHCESLVGFGYYEGFLELLGQQEYVKASSPVAKGVGIIKLPQVLADYREGIEIHGIDPVVHSRATGFRQTLHYTKDISNAFLPEYDSALDGCIPGVDVIPYRRKSDGSYTYWERPIPIEMIISSFPLNIKGGLLKGGLDIVNTKTFYYCDDSHSNLVRVDGAVVYMPLAQAQVLCGMDIPIERISDIHIKFTEGGSVQTNTEKIRTLWKDYTSNLSNKPGANLFENVQVQTWQENRRGIIAPIEREQTNMIVLFMMLGVITVFIIFVIMYMIISHKSKDIGILKSIGVSASGVIAVFMAFAAYVGLVGSLIGGVSGCVFLIKINAIEDWLYARYGFQVWNPAIFAIEKIPNKIEPDVVGIIVGSAILTCLLGAIIPGLQATRKKPVQVLQVNQL